ncbi:MAG: hypothetical protein ACHQK8_04505 [Bacteroidia bacterium]
MKKYFFFWIVAWMPFLAQSQGDTTLISFKRLFKWKSLPYDCSYNNKDFIMDSIWNSVDKKGFIRYRSEVKRKGENQLIPKFMLKRFLKMDSVILNKVGDTMHAEFFAIGYVGSIKDINCLIVERQFFSKYYRSSEKFLCTYDKKYKPIDRILLSREIPGSMDHTNNFDVFSDSFNDMTWFTESKAIIFEKMLIEIENETGQTYFFKVKPNGKIEKTISL